VRLELRAMGDGDPLRLQPPGYVAARSFLHLQRPEDTRKSRVAAPRAAPLPPEHWHLGERRGGGYGRGNKKLPTEAQPPPGASSLQVRRPLCAHRRQPDQPRESILYLQ